MKCNLLVAHPQIAYFTLSGVTPSRHPTSPLKSTSILDTSKMSVETINTISPTTNKSIVVRNGISPSELGLLPTLAAEAFEKYKTTTLAERKEIVRKALKLLSDKQDELAKELTEQMGRPIAYTAKEITTACKRGEYLLKICDEVLKDTYGEAERGFKRFIRKVPVGPVLVLFAWNVSLSQNAT